MAKLTKKMKAIKAGVDSTKAYEINEAIALLKQFATAKFVESVDVSVNLGIDPRKSDQNVRGATVLPHGTGREVRVAVFTQGANAEAAKAAGADLVGMEDLAEQVKRTTKIHEKPKNNNSFAKDIGKTLVTDTIKDARRIATKEGVSYLKKNPDAVRTIAKSINTWMNT